MFIQQMVLEPEKNVLISLVKKENVDLFLDGTARIYYTGKKFPSTVALNKLYYFVPYIKQKGIRDLYLIKLARVGSKHEVHPDADENDLRLVFEIEKKGQLSPPSFRLTSLLSKQTRNVRKFLHPGFLLFSISWNARHTVITERGYENWRKKITSHYMFPSLSS